MKQDSAERFKYVIMMQICVHCKIDWFHKGDWDDYLFAKEMATTM